MPAPAHIEVVFINLKVAPFCHLTLLQSGLVVALMTAKAKGEVSGVFGRLGRSGCMVLSASMPPAMHAATHLLHMADPLAYGISCFAAAR